MNDLHIDHSDLKHGFAIGKAHKLAEWSFRKEEREFERLCNRLRAAKWWREMKAEGGERWRRAVERYTKTNAERRGEKLAAFKARIVVRECPCCGDRFLPAFQPGMPRKYCSRPCSMRGWKRDNAEDVREYNRRWWKKNRAKKPTTITCAHCQKAFTKHSNAKFCSKKCGQASRYLARKQPKENASA
jgi:hypothetical protein